MISEVYLSYDLSASTNCSRDDWIHFGAGYPIEDLEFQFADFRISGDGLLAMSGRFTSDSEVSGSGVITACGGTVNFTWSAHPGSGPPPWGLPPAL
jgi:hypothetical protein